VVLDSPTRINAVNPYKINRFKQRNKKCYKGESPKHLIVVLDYPTGINAVNPNNNKTTLNSETKNAIRAIARSI
jgi:hypothetical protein